MSELDIVLKELGIQDISVDKNYWLVRTQGGEYFDEFLSDDFIAINWDEINDIDMIKNEDRESLKKLVSETYGNIETRPGHVANQIIRFVKEMKSGDIVLIPSYCSGLIAFGEIIEDDIYLLNQDELEDLEEGSCPFIKRRRVNWLKTIKRSQFDPYFYRLLNSHHTISNANEYAPYIDRSLYSFFKKGEEIHVIFEVRETKGINAIDLLRFINNVLSGIDLFNNITNSNYNKNEIDLKINVQSPGPIEFISYAAGIGIVLGAVSMFLFGGNFTFHSTPEEHKANIRTDGLLGTILKFKEEKHKQRKEIIQLQKELLESAEKLKIDPPK